MIRFRWSILIGAAILLALGCAKVSKDSFVRLKIVAPNHLRGILDKAAAQFYEENKIPVTIVYERGEKVIDRAESDPDVDAFLTYNRKRFDRLQKDTLISGGAYSCPFRLSLVLAGPAAGPALDDIGLVKKDHIRRVVIVDPEADYEGQLAKKILEQKRLWKKLQTKLIKAESAEHLLTWLTTGEADAAIMLESSLDERCGAVVHGRLDKPVAKYLLHCAAVAAGSKHKHSARAFLDLLDSRLCEIYNVRGVYQNEGQ